MTQNKKTRKFYATLAGTKALIAGLKLAGKNATHVPGNKALKVCPDFLQQIDKPDTIIGVTGTNGKTTVSNLIDDVLEKLKFDFIDNRFGGNIASGIVTALVKNSTKGGHMKKNMAVLEIDERMTTKIFPYVKPKILAVTNLFRDSYRRNAHSEYIFDILNSTIPSETRLVLNGEDMLSCHLAAENPRVYFGIEDRTVFMNETKNIIQDMTCCPQCGTRIEYDYIRYNHIGRGHCPNCGYGTPEHLDYAVETIDAENNRLVVRTPKETFDLKLIGDNITDVYNTITTVAVLMEFGISAESIRGAFEQMKITKTRYDAKTAGGKDFIMMVAKGQNPIACSRICDYVRRQPGEKAVVLIIDDFFDRKESSENIAWFFDTDFEFLNDPKIHQIVVGGLRQYDLRLRLLLAGIPEEKIQGCDDDVEAAEYVNLDPVERVYILHDIYTTQYAEAIRERLTKQAAKEEA